LLIYANIIFLDTNGILKYKIFAIRYLGRPKGPKSCRQGPSYITATFQKFRPIITEVICIVILQDPHSTYDEIEAHDTWKYLIKTYGCFEMEI
jgi:hypothetical protein